MERVDGDPTQYEEIINWARKLYPFDRDLIINGAQGMNAHFLLPDDGNNQDGDGDGDGAPLVGFGKGKNNRRSNFPKRKTYWGDTNDGPTTQPPAGVWPTRAEPIDQNAPDGDEDQPSKYPIFATTSNGGWEEARNHNEVFADPDTGEGMVEIPIFYQDFYTGDWLSMESMEITEATEEETEAWEKEQEEQPPGSEELLDVYNPNLNEDESDEEMIEGYKQEPGVYFLPVYMRKGKGKGRRKGGKGRKGRPQGKGRRPQHGLKGVCHLCGKKGHWKKNCYARDKPGGRRTKGKSKFTYAFQKGGKGKPSSGDGKGPGKGPCFKCGEMGHWQLECPKNAPGAHFAQQAAPGAFFTFPVKAPSSEAVRSDVYMVNNLPVRHGEKQQVDEPPKQETGNTFMDRIKDRPKIKFGISEFATDYK